MVMLVLMLLLAKVQMTMVPMLLLVLPLVAWVLVTVVAKSTWPPFSLEEKIVEVKMSSWILISRPHLRTWIIHAVGAYPSERGKSNLLHQIIFFSSPHSPSVIIFQILWNSLGSWSRCFQSIVHALSKHAPNLAMAKGLFNYPDLKLVEKMLQEDSRMRSHALLIDTIEAMSVIESSLIISYNMALVDIS